MLYEKREDFSSADERLYGIDFLRIIAMFFVIIGHIVGQGGILEFTYNNHVNYELALFVKIFSLCSINIFGVISGYVSYGSSLKWKKIVLLWFQIVFWTVIISCIFSIFHGDIWTKTVLANTFFPILSKTYWYMTGYFFVMLLSPIMNWFITKFPIWFVVTSIIIATVFLSIVITTSGNNGVWLCLLYMIGAVIKKSKVYEKLKPGMALSGYVMCVLITWMAVIIQNAGIIHWNRILWSVVGGRSDGLWPSSILMNLAGIFLLLWAVHLQLPEKLCCIIQFITPFILSVYLIHVNPLIFNWLGGKFVFLAENSLLIVFGTILFSVFIFMACIILDYIRYKIFEIVQNNIKKNKNCTSSAYHGG